MVALISWFFLLLGLYVFLRICRWFVASTIADTYKRIKDVDDIKREVDKRL